MSEQDVDGLTKHHLAVGSTLVNGKRPEPVDAFCLPTPAIDAHIAMASTQADSARLLPISAAFA